MTWRNADAHDIPVLYSGHRQYWSSRRRRFHGIDRESAAGWTKLSMKKVVCRHCCRSNDASTQQCRPSNRPNAKQIA